LADFDPNLELDSLETYWDKEGLCYSLMYMEKMRCFKVGFNILTRKEGYVISTNSCLDLNRAELSQIDVHYAKNLQNYLNNHPKLRIRFLSNGTSVTLDGMYQPFLNGLSLWHWAFVERDAHLPIGVLYSILAVFSFVLLMVSESFSIKSFLLSLLAEIIVSFVIYASYFLIRKGMYEKKYPIKDVG